MLIIVLQRFRSLPWLVVWGLLLSLARPALATHLLGGEMTYRYLDNTGTSTAPYRYEITVAVYNNCASSILGSTAPIAIYDKATGSQVLLTAANYSGNITSGLAYFSQTSLDACTTPVVPPGCTIAGNSQSYRLQKFVGIVSLPAASQGYYAYWSAFARNAGIVNILTPDSQSMTLYTMLAPPALANSSPVFVDKAVANLCVNDTTYILNNAVDPNGDRLAYAFGQPYGDGYPATFAMPPPPLVPYAAAQYTATTPLGTAAGNYSSISATTGIAKFRTTAALNDKFVVAIDVREYRTINGVEQLIGTTRRDVQLVVVSCPNTMAPVLSTSAPVSPTPRAYTMEAGSTLRIPFAATQADGHPLTFTASSVLLDGVGGYNATFNGLPGTLLAGNPAGAASVASAASPVAGTFVYTATCADARATPYDLTITVKDEGCAGKTVGDVLRITVVKPSGPTAVAGNTLVCGLGTQQTYMASGGTAPTVQWTVTGGTIVGSATANPVTVSWPTAGTGTVTAQGVTQYGCLVDLVTKNVTVSPAPTLTIAGNQAVCQGSSTTLTVAGGAAPYTLTGGAAPVSGAGPFVLSPSQTTTYTITSPASGSTCAATGQVTITVNPLPVANAGAAVSICAGGTGQLGAAPVAGSTYSWSPATGLSSSTAANPAVTLTNTTGTPITQTYTLTETSVASGCQASKQVTVTVTPPPVANPGASIALCSGGTGQLGAAPVAGNTYSWSPATGLSSSTVANPTVTLTNTTGAPITQTYTLTVTNTATTCGSTSTVAVTVDPLPVASAGAAVALCAGGTGQLGGAAVTGLTYSWSPATGLSSTSAANPTVTLTNPITQAYTLTVANAAGCTSTSTAMVTVNPKLGAAAGAAISFCSGDTGQLGAAAITGLAYSWSPATGLSSATAANPTVTLINVAAAATTQTYTLTVTNASGCTNTGTVAVTVNPLPTAAVGAPVAICSGGTGQLGAVPVTGVAYSWSPATGLSSSTAANPTITLTNTTGAASTQTYTLTATNLSTSCVNTGTVVVTVNPQPVASVGAAIALCSGSTGQLGAAPVAGNTYSWSPTTGLSSSTVANPTVTLTNPAAAPTTQTYTLTVANAATTCTSTGTVAVTVNPAVLPGAIGADQTVCAGGVPAPLLSLAAASGGLGSYDYQWELSTDNLTWKAIANVTSLGYAPSAVTATTYFRRRVAAGACGLFYTNVVTVRAQQLLIPTVALPTPPPQCAGTALTFTPVPANAGAAPTYQWFVNGAALGAGPALTSATLADGDVVQVLLTPTPGFCATGTAIGTARVSFTPVPLPTLTIKLQTALPVCQGAPISFSLDRATNLGLSPQYQWQIDGVAVRGATSPVFTSTTLRDGQVVSLVVRATTACGQPATVASGTVAVLVNPPVHVSAGPDQTIVEGESVVLQGTADGSYPVTWTPTQTLAFAGGDQLHPVATPTTTTTYVLAAGAGYCADQSIMTVTVRRRVRIPNAFTPNADNNDDTWQIAGIEDYPNSHVEVFNRWGQKLFEASGYNHGSEWNGTYKGEPLPFGTYYYVVTLGNGKAYTGPITVLR